MLPRYLNIHLSLHFPQAQNLEMDFPKANFAKDTLLKLHVVKLSVLNVAAAAAENHGIHPQLFWPAQRNPPFAPAQLSLGPRSEPPTTARDPKRAAPTAPGLPQ